MSEYPSRHCGNCPHLGAFQSVENTNGRPDTSYLQKNTVPKPRVTFKDGPNLDQHHLGVSGSNLKPNLTVAPVDCDKSTEGKYIPWSLNRNNEEQKISKPEQGYKGGILSCSETGKKGHDTAREQYSETPENLKAGREFCQ